MKVTRRSLLTGKTHTRELPINPRQLAAYDHKGVPVQTAFSNLNDEQREFIKTGITAEEWAALLPKEETSPATPCNTVEIG